ncbi:hypothetical protein DFP72DRAFT_897075 [Ephemerocybe angulata]|uniref:Secreted protein n=1 Tax=Ephemerocybe angulata TaxID=980116 RepID=A0A8H6HYX2_9AGAR|nr:hypothetical protein DFP72DRAFT_897075 [Tulosesus angulatus]
MPLRHRRFCRPLSFPLLFLTRLIALFNYHPPSHDIPLLPSPFPSYQLTVRELQRKEVPFPGSDLLAFLAPAAASPAASPVCGGQTAF